MVTTGREFYNRPVYVFIPAVFSSGRGENPILVIAFLRSADSLRSHRIKPRSLCCCAPVFPSRDSGETANRNLERRRTEATLSTTCLWKANNARGISRD